MQCVGLGLLGFEMGPPAVTELMWFLFATYASHASLSCINVKSLMFEALYRPLGPARRPSSQSSASQP